MLELFPDLKIVMLFRDPRDVLISFEAFRKREPINELKGNLAEQIENIMKHYAGRLSLHEEYQDRVFILRYEDLMQTPEEVLAPMLDFLGLDAGKNALAKMLQPLQGPDLQSRMHVTAGSKAKSVGRWRQNMPAAVAKQFAAHAEIMGKLRYPLHGSE